MARREPALWLCDLNTADLLSLSFPSKLCPRSLQGADGPAPACVSAMLRLQDIIPPSSTPSSHQGGIPLVTYRPVSWQGVTQSQMPVCPGSSSPPGAGQLRMPLGWGRTSGRSERGQRESPSLLFTTHRGGFEAQAWGWTDVFRCSLFHSPCC